RLARRAPPRAAARRTLPGPARPLRRRRQHRAPPRLPADGGGRGRGALRPRRRRVGHARARGGPPPAGGRLARRAPVPSVGAARDRRVPAPRPLPAARIQEIPMIRFLALLAATALALPASAPARAPARQAARAADRVVLKSGRELFGKFGSER